MTRSRFSAIAVALALLAACGGSSGSEAALDAKVFVVKTDDLPIVVKENAELQALRETIVRSEVEGQATIIFIIPEGTVVKQGERLVELDVSELVEKAANQAISVAKAEAALKQARKEKEILEKELTTNRTTAESKLRIAEMELEKLLGRRGGEKRSESKNGEMLKKLQALVDTPPAEPLASDPDAGADAPATAQVDPRTYVGLVDKVQQLLAVDGDSTGALDRDMGEMANKILQQVDQIRLAMADLKVKEDTFTHSRRLAKKQFITRNELEKDQLAWQSQVSKVTLAWNDLDLLVNYTLAKERIQLTQDRDNASLEVDRVKGSNEALEIKADSDLDSKEKEFGLAKERLENLQRQIKSAVIHAPTPGTVVYARLDRNRGGGEAVREGVQVRERQELIILPDTTKMRCVVKVQEAQVDKVTRGQAATVVVEAFQGESFPGRVSTVAPVADSNSGWMTSDRKVYTTMVELDTDNPDGRLRSRMAANVTIMVETVKNTLPIPLQAVARDRSVNYVWKEGPNGPVATVVKVGRQNSERVEILEGVRDGDRVHLKEPAGVQPPKFEQPVVAVPAAAAPTTAGADGARPDANGPGGTSGTGRRNPGASMKKLAEMSATELEEYKGRLDMMQGMVDRMRDGGNADGAAEAEAAISGLRKALESNDLAAGQVHQDKLRTLMRAAMPRRNGGGNGNGGGGPPGDGGGSRGERGN
ncbi:MAG: efflux RND transporter periplasmic adaptor subunit [Planctomycetes bacterium]|nr:efflux RND transporter periplasmic adaptor subunit [Planctomycetota bacterium]